ncbi:DUF424 family protein [Candidatus Pacearchaeota archaeon]|nr:DUF424 family protein [Candidatus Pacearchaeota archaeon]
MLVKIHDSYRTTISICDSNLLEKTFEEKEREIKITKSFFGGEEKTKEEVLGLIEEYSANDATFNIVGEESVKIALESGIIKQEGITTIQGIPIALVLL